MLEWPSDETRDAGDPLQRQTPFLGRAGAFARLSQYLNTSHPGALVYVGAEGVGKTALLHAVAQHMTTNQIGLGVLIPLESLPTQQNELALALYQAAYGALVADRGVSSLPSRLPELPDPTEGAVDWMDWLAQVGLPGISQALRPNRRLIYLLDNVQIWIEAIEQKTLAQDFPASLAEIASPFSDKIALVFTLDLEKEAQLDMLSPLIRQDQTMRLTQVTEEEVIEALNENQAAEELYRWTGGYPLLIAPYLRVESPRKLSVKQIEEMTPQVYSRCQEVFQQWWRSLTTAERQVLAAISTAQYIDPFKAVTAAEIESWLVQTEIPMDMTAIQAALRGLEYRELIVYETGAARGVRLKSDLFRRWLREHADFDSPAAQPGSGSQVARGALAELGTNFSRLSPTQRIWFGIGVVVLLILVLVAVITAPPREVNEVDNDASVPTVTLAAPSPGV
jgi:hypothetical protein